MLRLGALPSSLPLPSSPSFEPVPFTFRRVAGTDCSGNSDRNIMNSKGETKFNLDWDILQDESQHVSSRTLIGVLFMLRYRPARVLIIEKVRGCDYMLVVRFI